MGRGIKVMFEEKKKGRKKKVCQKLKDGASSTTQQEDRPDLCALATPHSHFNIRADLNLTGTATAKLSHPIRSSADGEIRFQRRESARNCI